MNTEYTKRSQIFQICMNYQVVVTLTRLCCHFRNHTVRYINIYFLTEGLYCCLNIKTIIYYQLALCIKVGKVIMIIIVITQLLFNV